MEEFEHRCYYENCDKCFKTKYNLRRHINSNHLLIKEFTCQICSRMFASKQNLKGHEKIHFKSSKIPELEIPIEIKRRRVKIMEDIEVLKLSKIYAEPKIVVFQEYISNINKPILPLVCNERTDLENKMKLPIIPILLKLH